MHPVIVQIGPLKLYSFGLMVVMAFLFGGWLTTRELARRKIAPAHLEGFPLGALVGGVVGARLYYLLEHLSDLLRDPRGSLFSGSGLTWYGGAIGGALTVLIWARRKRQPLWTVCDAFAPGLAACYAIGRIGCQLAGDGDYGPPSDLPWAMAYPKGVVPTTVPVHPTPVYELLAMGLVTWMLWRLRLRPWSPGRLFGVYLMLAGLERLLAEFVRVNPRVALGLSTAQWLSVAAFVLGAWIFAARRRAPTVSS